MATRSARLLAWAVSRWCDDPWARGGWSLLGVGASVATRQQLRRPIGGRLLLAGEATHPSQAGMAHGAFEEGVRAARWCLAQRHREVLVVGAGCAGLGAARALRDGGAQVVVVEARQRLGGRVHTVELLPGIPVELGANFLQQGKRNTLAPLAAAVALTTVPVDFNDPTDLAISAPFLADAAMRSSLHTELQHHVAAAAASDSLKDLLERWTTDCPDEEHTVRVQRFFDGMVTLDAGAPLALLSASHGLEPGVGEGDRFILGGYGQLLSHLARETDVRFGQAVGEIHVGADRVTARARDSYECDALILTVPTAVLRSGAITFDPVLPPSHQRALSQLVTGAVEKVALAFDNRWWPCSPTNYMRVFGAHAGEVCEWLDLTDVAGTPVVVGLFAGTWARSLWSGSDQTIAERTAKVLSTACR